MNRSEANRGVFVDTMPAPSQLRRRLPFVALGVCLLAFLLGSVANASVPTLDVDYDLDSPPAPSPASENFLDVYRPDGSDRSDSRPVVVYVHGGGWRIGDKSNQIAEKVELFTERGYVFASINYRLSPDPVDPGYDPERVRFPDHPHDVGEALGWIDRNISRFGGDPTRLLLIGHSAGAHLVSLVSTDHGYIREFGVEPWKLIGAVALDTDAYDVSSRIAELPPSQRPLFYNAFGTPAENAASETWNEASPIRHADEGDPEHLLVTQAANPNRRAGATAMAGALGADPASSVLPVPYDHAGINRAVGSADDPAGETQAIVDFFSDRVAAARAPKLRLTDRPSKRVRAKRRRVKVQFSFRSSVPEARFECRLRSGKLRACRSPYARSVRPGRYRFRARAIAPDGRPGGLKSFRFRVVDRR